MHRIKIITTLLLIASLIAMAGSYFLPQPAPTPQNADPQGFTIVMTAILSLNIVVIVLFLLGLRGFTPAFQRSYYLIVLGMAIQTLGTIVYLFTHFSGNWGSPLYISAAEIPLAIGIVIIYLGLWQFARLLQIRHWSNNLVVVGALAAVGTTIAIVAPHRPVETSEFVFDFGHVLLFFEAYFYALSGILSLVIIGTASRLYRKSLLWLGIGLVIATAGAGLLLFANYVTYPDWLQPDAAGTAYIICNIFIVASAYTFNKITRLPRAVQTQDGALDSITFLFSLVSKPSEVIAQADELRDITSIHDREKPYSAQETERLTKIFTELEDYLVTKERLRSFDRTALRTLVQERYNWLPQKK